MKEKGIEEDIKQWRDDDYDTILLAATMMGRKNIIRWLLHELKFDVNEQNSYGETALHFTAIFNQMERARLLLDAGSQLLKDRSGNTPLDYAKRCGYKEMKRLLESHFQLS